MAKVYGEAWLAILRCRKVAQLDRQLSESEAKQYRKDLALVIDLFSPTEIEFQKDNKEEKPHDFYSW